jgi:hypothetical protein
MYTESRHPPLTFLPLVVLPAALATFPFLLALYPNVTPILQAPLLILLAFCALILVWAPGLAMLGLFRNRIPSSLAPCVAIVGVGLSGWLLFWLWFIGPAVGIWGTIGVSLASAIVLWRNPVNLLSESVRFPVIIMVLLTVGYLSVAGDHGWLEYGDYQIGARYWAIPDNQIPSLFANGLLNGGDGLRPYLLGDWHSSDRPPLETGMILIAFPLLGEASQMGSLLLSIAVNVSWVFGLWGFLRAVAITEWRILTTVVSVGLSGVVFINTLYSWPKMLAAAFSLTVAAAVFEQQVSRRLKAVIIGAAAAFSMLSHGSAIFALLALFVLVITKRHTGYVRDTAIALLTATMIYIPWVCYQKFYDPPGDRLIKWHLAGIIEHTDNRSPLPAILEEYRRIGWSDLVTNKTNNLRMLIGDPTVLKDSIIVANSHPAWDDTFMGRIRNFFLLRVGPSPSFLLFGIPFLLFRRVRTAFWMMPIAAFILLTAGFFVFLEFGASLYDTTWLHHAPYQLVLLWCALGPLAVSEISKKLSGVLVSGQLVIFIALWDYGVTVQSAISGTPVNPRDPAITMLSVIISMILLWLVFRYDRMADSKTPAISHHV